MAREYLFTCDHCSRKLTSDKAELPVGWANAEVKENPKYSHYDDSLSQEFYWCEYCWREIKSKQPQSKEASSG